MFKTRKIQGVVETPNVQSLSEKIGELTEINRQILSMNANPSSVEIPDVNGLYEKIDRLMSDNKYFRQKQEEFDKKDKGIIQKIKDYWKGE